MGRPTLADVARRARVSASTASLAFSGAGPVAPTTKQRVLAAAAELGYRGPDPIARSLRRGASGVVGVIVGKRLSTSFRDPAAVRTLDGIADTLGAHDLGMLLLYADDAAPALPDLVRNGAMDAAVLSGVSGANRPLVEALQGRGVPVVTIEIEHPDVPHVRIADRQGMAELAARVRHLGHEKVGVVSLPCGPRPAGGLTQPGSLERAYTFSRRRLAGISDGGIDAVALYEAKGSLVDEGFEAGRALLSLPERPTAILALSDLLAAGVVLAARELALRIPEDLSVTGFDGVDLPWLSPDVLATVTQPFVEKGAVAARTAIELAAGRPVESVELPVEQQPGSTLSAPGQAAEESA